MSLPIPTLPSATGAFSIASPNFSVSLPSTIDSGPEEKSFTNYIENVDALDGGIKTRGTSRDPVELELSGVLFSASTVSDLVRVLGEKSVTITRGGRTLDCEVSQFSLKNTVENEIWLFSASFVSPDGYWSDGFTTTSTDPATIINNGDIETYPRFTVTGGVGGATAIQISSGGRDVIYTGAIAESEVLVIDTFEGTAKLDGVSVLSNLNNDFFTNPIRFTPGSNSLVYSVTGSASTVVRFEERYL